MQRPVILISNDDGYSATGIVRLFEQLSEWAEVYLCAPAVEQSAASHTLTLRRPLLLREHAERVFSVDGSPADAVYTALHGGGRILPRPPNLVVSGINHGLNLGSDIWYSGTVAAAREGALRGIPAVAFSADPSAPLDRVATAASHFAQRMSERLPAPVLLNVNFPNAPTWAYRATCLGRRLYREGVEFRRAPRGGEYLWLGLPGVEHLPVAGSDTEAYDAGLVSVTPLGLDCWSATDMNAASAVIEKL